MDADELIKVSNGVMWVGERMSELPEEREAAAQASMICGLASLVVMELAYWLAKGDEPNDALLKAARGEKELTPEQQTMWKILRPPRADSSEH